MSRNARTSGDRPRLRRVAAVVGALAVTALCFSVACSIAGGLYRPATSESIAVATASETLALSPPPPPHLPRRGGAPVAAARFADAPTEWEAAGPRTTMSVLRGATRDGSLATHRSNVSAQGASTLLHAESKASRTRGQPWRV